MSILTLTLNPALDLTLQVPTLLPEHVNRATTAHMQPAGKGLNVACVLKSLKQEVSTFGLIGISEYTQFQNFCQDKGIPCHWLQVAGNTRINIKIADDAHQMTEINMPSFVANTQHLQDLQKVLEGVKHKPWIVLAGSLPQGLPENTYESVIQAFQTQGSRVFFDASGPAFEQGLKANPFFIKPNRAELEELLQKTLVDTSQIVAAGQNLVQKGIEHVVISDGPQGVYWVTQDACYRATPPKIAVRSTVGAGDSLVAGMVYGIANQFTQEETLRFATAVSALAVTQVNVGVHDQKECDLVKQQVRIERLQ